MTQQKFVSKFLVVCSATVLVIPFLFYLLKIHQYIPGFDETYQIEAGVRISRGLGNTYSWVMGKDISIPSFSYQNAWPIGYSFILSILLYIGLPLIMVLKLIKSVIILLSIYFWIRFSNNFLEDIYYRIILACLVTGHIILCSVSITDMTIIMLVPVVSSLIFSWGNYKIIPDSNRRKVLFDPFYIGILIALIILVKYSGLFLILSGIAWISYLNIGNLKKCLISLVKFGIPVIFIVAVISISNLVYTSNINSVTTKGLMLKTSFFYQGWLGDIVNAFFNATHLNKMLEKLPLKMGISDKGFLSLLKFSFLLTFFLSLIFILKNKGKKRLLASWVIINCISAAIFLKTVTIFYFSDNADWTPVKEGRFYWSLIPFLILCVLVAVEDITRTFNYFPKLIMTSLIFAFTFFGVNYYSKIKYNIYKDLDNEISTLYPKVKQIIGERKTNSVVYFGDAINWQLYPDKGTSNFFVSPPVFLSGNYFSKNTMLIMICSCKNYSGISLCETNCVDSEFEQIAKRYKFNSMESGSNTKLFWKVFPAGFTFK